MADKETSESIESCFKNLDTYRTASLNRKRECAELTIPSLLPYNGFNETQELDVPYSSSPARMVSALASKLVSVTQPLNNLRYFEIEVANDVEENQDPAALIKMLASKEAQIVSKLGSTNLRQMSYVAMQHLIVNGDVLMCMYDNFTFQVHRIDNYVVQRFGDGRVWKIILREWVNRHALPEDLKNVPEIGSMGSSAVKDWEPSFLEIEYDDASGKWEWEKEFRGKRVSTGTWDLPRYWAMRWQSQSNENYGRSLCEENIGDLRKLHGISKAIVDGIAINSEGRWGVDPSGITEARDLIDSENWSFVPARQQDLFAVQVNSMVQVQAMHMIAADLENSLAKSFLMETAAQPRQDRVTATQIRSISNEMDMATGGVLSMLNVDFMQPVIRNTLFLEQKRDPEIQGILKLLNANILNLKIRTGLEALGREAENSQIGGLVAQVLQMPPSAQEVINWSNLVSRWFNSTGINTNGLVLTPEEQDAKRQQMMQEQAMAQGATEGIKAGLNNAQGKQ